MERLTNQHYIQRILFRMEFEKALMVYVGTSILSQGYLAFLCDNLCLSFVGGYLGVCIFVEFSHEPMAERVVLYFVHFTNCWSYIVTSVSVLLYDNNYCSSISST